MSNTSVVFSISSCLAKQLVSTYEIDADHYVRVMISLSTRHSLHDRGYANTRTTSRKMIQKRAHSWPAARETRGLLLFTACVPIGSGSYVNSETAGSVFISVVETSQ